MSKVFRTTLLFFLALFASLGISQEKEVREQGDQTQETNEPLFVVHFETGSAWNTTLGPNEQTGFAEHSANLNRLRREGIIRFGARYAEFGMIIIGAESLTAATAVIEQDPGVQAKIFTFKIDPLNVFYPWTIE